MTTKLQIVEDSFRKEKIDKQKLIDGRYIKGSLLGEGGFAKCY